MYPLESFDPHRYEDRATDRDFARSPELGFDRLAFAMHALRLLRMPRTRVAVFPSHRISVESGRELGAVADARWAMVGIPSDASPRSIVLALSEIARSSEDSSGLQAAWAAAEHMERAH